MTNILNWEFKLNGRGNPDTSGLPLPLVNAKWTPRQKLYTLLIA